MSGPTWLMFGRKVDGFCYRNEINVLPDVIISSIITSGNINERATGLDKIETNLVNTYPLKNGKTVKTTNTRIAYYCSKCDRLYKTYGVHIKSKTHKNKEHRDDKECNTKLIYDYYHDKGIQSDKKMNYNIFMNGTDRHIKIVDFSVTDHFV